MTDQAHNASAGISGVRIDADSIILFIGRFCLANAFMVFGIRKFLHPEQIYGFITSYHIPGVPGELVYLAMPWQIVWGWTVFFGIQTRLGAAALCAFCIVAPSIFWLGSLENLTRDYCVAGGFILLFMTGAGAFSVDAAMGWSRNDLLGRMFPRWMETLSSAAWVDRLTLIARILIASPFLADAVKKVIFFSQERAFLESANIPGSAIYLVILIELICGLAILFDYKARIAAAILAVWVLIPAFILHNPQLGLLTSDWPTVLGKLFVSNGGNVMTFEKDLGSLGALILVMFNGVTIGAGRRSAA